VSAPRPDDVLRAFSRQRARPCDRLDLLALVRGGLDEQGVASAVRGCASRGYVIDRGFSAELTEAGYRALRADLG
jgi:hypothetical protein